MSDFLRDLLKRRCDAQASPFVFPSESERGDLIEPRTAVERLRRPMQRITDFLIAAIQTDAENTPDPLKR